MRHVLTSAAGDTGQAVWAAAVCLFVQRRSWDHEPAGLPCFSGSEQRAQTEARSVRPEKAAVTQTDIKPAPTGDRRGRLRLVTASPAVVGWPGGTP